MIKHLYIDQAVASHPKTHLIVERLKRPFKLIETPQAVFNELLATNDPEAEGKRTLIVTRNRGRFLRQCPGTRHYRCCGYQILHIGTYCTMDCAYCILQAYFHPPVLQYFVNQEDLWGELDVPFSAARVSRIGTGEFTDSLIWEPWAAPSPQLIKRFATQDHAVLELKTKTTAIDHLLNLDHNGKTILAWSLNTPRMIASQERCTASLKTRLTTAARCQAHGYPVAFHFDPLILYEGCEAEYNEVIEMMAAVIDFERVVWISLGALRYMPSLKPIIQRRFSDSKIPYGEFSTGWDGKVRYFRPLRTALYRSMIMALRDHHPDLTLYFCMESDDVWQQTMGYVPSEQGGIAAMLDRSAVRHCRLDTTLEVGV
jgi:spore photoproduct lyase